MRKSDAEVRAEFADLLEGSDEPRVLEVVKGLEEGWSSAEPPDWLVRAVPHQLPQISRREVNAVSRRRVNRWHGGIALLLVAALAGAAIATANIGNLGKSTNDLDLNHPLGSFRHIGGSLKHGALPELLFLAAYSDDDEQLATWPIVKALGQFGTFGHLAASRRYCQPPGGDLMPCNAPGFDFSKATYRSRYIAFAHVTLLADSGKPFQKPTAAELQFFRRYVNKRSDLKGRKAIETLAGNGDLPVISVGGYLASSFREILEADVRGPYAGPTPTTCPNGCIVNIPPGQDRPFSDVQQSLATGNPVNGLPTTLITDVNAATNILTALICHADGKKPTSVCGRPAVSTVLKYIK